jgi:hypothetical protein
MEDELKTEGVEITSEILEVDVQQEPVTDGEC